MTDTSRPTGRTVAASVPAELITAAGTGSNVDYVRSPWTLGDLRALLEAVPRQFDRTPVVLSDGQREAPVASIDLERGLTLHAGQNG